MKRVKVLKPRFVGTLLIEFFRSLVLSFLSSKIALRILGDIPRDLFDIKRGFSYDFNENGEFNLIRRVAELSNSESVVFDIGANIGEYSQAFLDSNYTGLIHLFEIDSELIELLGTRFAGNSKILINQFGLSNVGEVREFNRFIDHTGANSLFPILHQHLKSEKTVAKLVVGDDYCSEQGINAILFAKLDVEGWERYVLEGLAKSLIQNKIEIISWEYGYVSGEAGWTSKDFYTFFGSLGYICGVIRQDGVDFRSWDYSLNDWKSGPNFLACLPKYKVELERFV